jgi:protein SCO1
MPRVATDDCFIRSPAVVQARSASEGFCLLNPRWRFRLGLIARRLAANLRNAHLAWLVMLPVLTVGVGCLQTPSPPVPDLGTVGDFSLTERGGKTKTQADLLGKVWVASFVFTRCSGPCPQVSAAMARLQSDFTREKDFALVTFTVDPAHDQLKELTEYANLFKADPDRWWFLTGKEKTIHDLVNKGFKVGVERNQDKDVNPGTSIRHDPRLVLVDRQGHIRGYFQGLPDSRDEDPTREFERNLKLLRESIAVLLREETR